MASILDYDQINDALRRSGSSWDAAQAHGLLSSRLAVGGILGGQAWLAQLQEDLDSSNASDKECAAVLSSMIQPTFTALTERLSAFSPLLPEDGDTAECRIDALAHWCEGYLHGLVSTDRGEAVRKRLAERPISDIIKDMLEITRAGGGDDDDEEGDEAAYVEIVEYLRVAAQLVYEELSELRPEALHEA